MCASVRGATGRNFFPILDCKPILERSPDYLEVLFLGRSPWFIKLEFSDSRLCRGVARGKVPTYPFLLFCVCMWLSIFRTYDVCMYVCMCGELQVVIFFRFWIVNPF